MCQQTCVRPPCRPSPSLGAPLYFMLYTSTVYRYPTLVCGCLGAHASSLAYPTSVGSILARSQQQQGPAEQHSDPPGMTEGDALAPNLIRPPRRWRSLKEDGRLLRVCPHHRLRRCSHHLLWMLHDVGSRRARDVHGLRRHPVLHHPRIALGSGWHHRVSRCGHHHGRHVLPGALLGDHHDLWRLHRPWGC
jgi:hypothetical protein